MAHYQNDGTPTIRPAHFVELAERQNRSWVSIISRAIDKFMNNADTDVFGRVLSSGPDKGALGIAGARIARDIGQACSRIDTGRLKRSFTYRIVRRAAGI